MVLKIVFGIVVTVNLFNILNWPIHAYNVDTTYPIVITNEADGPESYFGATVELVPKTKDSPWIIIGAPRANSTFRSHENIFEPGVIWRCSIGKSNDECEVVMMDPSRELVTEQGVKDRKDGGWLGGSSFAGDSSRFVTCASRWANQKYANNSYWESRGVNEYLLNGICYWRNKKDICEDNVPDLPNNYRLLPLSAKKDLDKQGDFYWTYGQSGFSVHVTNDDTMILGAPGIDNWRGSVIRYSDDEEPVRLQRNGQPALSSNIFNQSLVVASELSGFLENGSYFGYAVTSGKFFDDPETDRKTQFVGGAPRGTMLSGKVVIFHFPKSDTEPMEKLAVIEGTQTGSYFGSVLCALDINNDGFDDLIIGAPRYTVRSPRTKLPFKIFSESPPPEEKPTGESSTSEDEHTEVLHLLPFDSPFGGAPKRLAVRGDEGAAFVYMSSGESLDLKGTLHGDSLIWAQFGSSLASAGDLNHDGFNDLVVGAPYTQEGKGSIYIYHGNAKGIADKYAQVIHASLIDSGLRGFGFSLSRGVDLDNNGVSDIAVGSYESAQIVILRSRPAVTIIGQIKTTLKRLPLNATQFTVYSCVTFSGFNLPRSLDIGVKLFSDIDSKPPRVLLKKSGEDGTPSKEFIYEELAYKEVESCTQLRGVIVRPLESGNPVKIRQQVFLPEKDSIGHRQRGRKEGATRYNIKRSSTGRVSVDISGKSLKDFCTTCPTMNYEQQNTTVFSLPLEVLCGDDEKCVADLRVDAAFENIRPGDNFTIGSAPTLVLQVNLTNAKETAVSPGLTISFSRRNLVRIPPSCQSIPGNTTLFYSYKCSFGRTLEKGQVVGLSMELDMTDLSAGGQNFEKEFLFMIEGTTSSDLENPAMLTLVLPVNASADVHLAGNKDTILFSATTLTNYQILSHIYDVRMVGQSTISNMWLRFKIPISLKNAQRTQEVIQVFSPVAEVDVNEMMCRPIRGVFQPRTSETFITRNTQLLTENVNEPDPSFDAVMIQPSMAKEYSEIGRTDVVKTGGFFSTQRENKFFRGSTLHFDCATEHVECMEVLCKFRNFKPTSRGSVIINMRISSNVTRKLFQQEAANILVIKTTGEITLIDVDHDIQGKNELPDKSEASTTIKLDRPRKVSRWIIMGSVVGGILLLACIIFGLYSAGCLDRKKSPIVEADEDENIEEPEFPEEEQPLQDQTDMPISSSLSEPLEPILEELEEHSESSELEALADNEIQ